MDISKLISVEVDHCPYAFAPLLLNKNNEKLLVYSGDSRPCQNLVNYAKYAKLLIHEATFDDSYAQEALRKKHSTISDALKVSKKAKVEHTILTHFSNRYSKFPPYFFDTENVLVAFDHMRVTLKDLEWAHKMVPIYRELLFDPNEPLNTTDDSN